MIWVVAAGTCARVVLNFVFMVSTITTNVLSGIQQLALFKQIQPTSTRKINAELFGIYGNEMLLTLYSASSVDLREFAVDTRSAFSQFTMSGIMGLKVCVGITVHIVAVWVWISAVPIAFADIGIPATQELTKKRRSMGMMRNKCFIMPPY